MGGDTTQRVRPPRATGQDPGDTAATQPVTGSAGAAAAPDPAAAVDSRQLVAIDADRQRPGAPGDRQQIGPYQVLEPLGSGGMGTVYLAEQQQPRRKVAIKLIRTSLASHETSLRFEAERQALARMNHSCVAQVYDAGTTDDGQPYIVMEHVPGEPITAFCDRRCLDLRQRLQLVIAVCRGVQHAHQKGIIHRDLKPSNLLVIEAEGQPLPKIIDFGIAKALDQPLTEQTLLTGDRIVGTPAYLSPEAIETGGHGADIDTRCDVYALGVVLYELLAGARPFAGDGGSILNLAMRILEEEAPPPVTRLASLAAAEQQAVAAARQLEPPALRRQLRGDLTWITMKAIAKERSLRYQSAAELAADLERYLAREPVLASPPTLAYRAGKLIRRHWVGVVAATTVLLALIGGTIGTTLGMLRARRAEAAAQRDATTARTVSDFLVRLFEVSDPFAVSETGAPRGESVTARELLDHGAERLGQELAGQPEIRSQLLNTVGRVYKFLGLYDDSQRLTEQALALRRATLGEEHALVADSLYNLAELRLYQGDYDAAETLYRQTLAMRRRLLGDENVDVAEVLNDLGVVLRYKGDLAAAEQPLTEALAMYRKLLGEHHWVALTMNNLADLLSERGDRAAAEPLYLEALTMFRATVGHEHPYVTVVLNNLAALVQSKGDFAAAEPLLREALALRRKELGDEHPLVAVSLGNLAVVLKHRGRTAEARQLYEQALAMQQRLLGEDSSEVAFTMVGLASVRALQGEPAAAEQLARQALAMQRRQLGEQHLDVAWSRVELALLLCRRGALNEAAATIELALTTFREVMPADHWSIANAESVLGAVLTGQARYEEAEALLVHALPVVSERVGEQSLYTRAILQRLAELFQAWGKPDQAAAYRQRRQAADHQAAAGAAAPA